MKNNLIKVFFLTLLIISCKTEQKGKTYKNSKSLKKETEQKEKIQEPKLLKKEIKYVSATSGLIYRDKVKGKPLGKFEFNTKIHIIDHTNVFQEIKDGNEVIKGEWVVTKLLNNKKVYIFNGFLSDNINSEKKQLINIEKIDSIQFLTEKNKTISSEMTILKLTDVNEVKKLLNGIIKFDKIDEETIVEVPIERIKFRNGITITNKEGLLWDSSFVSYFPDEDILLLSNPAGGDESFNLKNGKGIEETGNPNLLNYSPKKTYRLNGYINGQGTCFYFFQQRINNEYKKTISLSDEIEKLKDHWIFYIKESFWINESTFYIKETGTGTGYHYFKIKILK